MNYRVVLVAIASLSLVAAQFCVVGPTGISADVVEVVVVPCQSLEEVVADACAGKSSLAASDTQAIDSALGDGDDNLEVSDLEELSADPAEIEESAKDTSESLLVFAFVDLSAEISFDSGDTLAFLPNDGGSTWTCAGGDDPDCGDDSPLDGVVTANLVNVSAVAGDLITVRIGSAELDVSIVGPTDVSSPTPVPTSEPAAETEGTASATVTNGDDADNGNEDSSLLGFVILGFLVAVVIGGGGYIVKRMMDARRTVPNETIRQVIHPAGRLRATIDRGRHLVITDPNAVIHFSMILGDGDSPPTLRKGD